MRIIIFILIITDVLQWICIGLLLRHALKQETWDKRVHKTLYPNETLKS